MASIRLKYGASYNSMGTLVNEPNWQVTISRRIELSGNGALILLGNGLPDKPVTTWDIMLTGTNMTNLVSNIATIISIADNIDGLEFTDNGGLVWTKTVKCIRVEPLDNINTLNNLRFMLRLTFISATTTWNNATLGAKVIGY